MLNLYVHIPFCRSRCIYCDFFLVTRRNFEDRFFTALAEETAAKAYLLGNRSVGAIHFGGGTPSLMPAARFSGWIEQISRLCTLDSNAEITLEANPEDLDRKTLLELKAAGINRLSIGVQSFISRKLYVLGRAHDFETSRRTVQEALDLFDSVSIDLMCGVEGETSGEWEEELLIASAIQPQHISVYMLTLEEKTVLWKQVLSGRISLPEEDVQASMYVRAAEILYAQGYIHYEVSNYALPGFHSRYNLDCWQRRPYLGFGPSAHSFLVAGNVETRFSNVCSLLRYLDHPGEAVDFSEELTPGQQFNEKVFLSLRINSGLDVEFLRKGHKLGHQRLTALIRDFSEKGWITVNDGTIRLTDRGFLFADLIAGELMPE